MKAETFERVYTHTYSLVNKKIKITDIIDIEKSIS